MPSRPFDSERGREVLPEDRQRMFSATNRLSRPGTDPSRPPIPSRTRSRRASAGGLRGGSHPRGVVCSGSVRTSCVRPMAGSPRSRGRNPGRPDTSAQREGPDMRPPAGPRTLPEWHFRSLSFSSGRWRSCHQSRRLSDPAERRTLSFQSVSDTNVVPGAPGRDLREPSGPGQSLQSFPLERSVEPMHLQTPRGLDPRRRGQRLHGYSSASPRSRSASKSPSSVPLASA